MLCWPKLNHMFFTPNGLAGAGIWQRLAARWIFMPPEYLELTTPHIHGMDEKRMDFWLTIPFKFDLCRRGCGLEVYTTSVNFVELRCVSGDEVHAIRGIAALMVWARLLVVSGWK